MSDSEALPRQSDPPTGSAVDQLTAVSDALPHSVRRVTSELAGLQLECQVLRNGWVIYAVDLLGPDVAVRPQREEGAPGPCLTACAVWEISEGGYRWVRPIVEQLDAEHPGIDFNYVPEKGTIWASHDLGDAELSAEQILDAMCGLADACAKAWREIGALGLGRRFHSAWLSEDLMPGGRTLAQVRRELLATKNGSAASHVDEPGAASAGNGAAAA
jgi:hypothetical protein